MVATHSSLAEPSQWDPEAVFRQAPFLITVLLGPEGRVVFCTPTVQQLWGGRDALGKVVADVWPELDDQGYFDIFRRVYRTGKPVYGNERLVRIDRRNNGKLEDAYFNFLCEPYRDADRIIGVIVYGIEVSEQVLARQRAVQNEERYQAFIHNSNEGIWRCELDEPIPTNLPAVRQIALMYERAYMAEANEAMAAMYGFDSIDPLIGLRLDQLLVRDDPRNTEYLQAFIQADYRLSGVESHEIDRQGRDKYFRNSLVGIVQDGAVVRAWGTQQDITEQHLAAEALRKSEERLALALKASEMGIWEWDMRTGELTWSAELKHIFGLDEDADITYEAYLSYFEPGERERMGKIVKRAVQRRESFQVEHCIVWPDGSRHWLQSHGQAFWQDGKPIKMIGTSRNIDARKAAEMRLQESEARFRTTADTAPVLIWIADANKQCTYFNKPWLEFTGRKLADEIGDGWAEDLHPDDRKHSVQVYHTSFDKRELFQMEYRLRRADGEYRWVLDNGRPRFSPDGEFLGYIGSCLDIHDFKQAVERRKELEARTRSLTEQREHLMVLNQAKDEFISLASHQLRTPATAVKQYVGMLLEGYTGPLSDEQRALLTLAFDSNERQIGIVNDLLRVAHIDAGQVVIRRQPASLTALVASVLDEQLPTFRTRQQKVVRELPSSKLLVPFDAGKVRMVVENIIDNASKYTAPGKTITVRVEADRKQAHVHVTDQGVGIAKKDIPKLFQKFSRISNERSTEVGGSGLGLYWAKKIMDLHDGAITVTSRPHKGTTFTITLPRVVPKKEQA